MKLYITAMSLFVLVVFYLPLVLWVLKRIWNSPRWHGIKKAGILILALILAYAIPLGDVTVNSLAMDKVCPTAGLHIYKTVEVEGFAGDLGGRDDLERFPYRFVEAKSPGGHIVRYERQPDGSISVERGNQPTAEYEVVSVQWHFDKKLYVDTSSYLIRNRVTGDVLAEYPIFKSLPGWVDRFFVYRWFGYGGRDGCYGLPTNNFIQQVLIPKNS